MPKAVPKYLIPQFVLAHFSHHMATGILVPILPLLREDFGLNYFQSGILVSAFSISYGLGQIPMAMLADRFKPRPIILLGLVGVSFTGIVVSFTHDFWQMAVCFVAMGLIGGTYHAPSSTFISQLIPSSKRGRALGMHITGGAASFSLTPAMALSTAALFHTWRASFFVLALPALIVGYMLWLTTRQVSSGADHGTKRIGRSKERPAEKESATEKNGPHKPWLEIIRALGFAICLAMALQIVFSSVSSYLPLYMVDKHNISPKWAGIVISVISVASLVGAPLGGALSDRFGRKQVILFAFCLAGPFFFAVIRSPFGFPLLLSLLCYGMAMSFRMATMESLIVDVAPVGRRATVLGVYFFLGQETTGITTPIVGWFIDRYGLDPVFMTLAIGLCALAVFALLLRKRW